ncbi:DUF1826 domain-containing protein [Halomonas nitroreducens]|uniref:DUF1826 domain-containing protein n=1 Tax=Halomonas nitroreducens TaxID=447425 RepID=A0A431V5U2_9GAMM|nr:DUF1826 domain-containing protein [Halomonas nitroreducens]RTR05942.1 DUF1826 domain-containing protein [Halomonas nitroreducens]
MSPTAALPSPDLPTATPHWVEGGGIEVLPRIFEDAITLAVLRRPLPHDLLAGALAQVRAERPLSFAWRGKPGDDLRAALLQALHCPGISDSLVEDIVILAEAMACLFDTQDVGLRLRRLDAPMCPRFHCDQLPVRLVTTYLGPGSEWLPEHAVHRAGLGAPHPGKPAIVLADAVIHRLETGDVALFKGGGWIGNEGKGLVHRSPTLGSDQPRLLLTIDPA